MPSTRRSFLHLGLAGLASALIHPGARAATPAPARGGRAKACILLFMHGGASQLDTFDQGTGEYKNNRATYSALFFQDDFKVHKRFTLNLGLRYEPTPPWHEVRGRIERFTFEDYRNGVRSKLFQNAPPGVLFRGDPGVPEDGTLGDWNNFGVRFGFAWDVGGSGKTSLRGGFGMFYNSVMFNVPIFTAFFANQRTILINNPGFPDPFSRGAAGNVPISTYRPEDDMRVPRSYSATIGVQREIGPGLAVSVWPLCGVVSEIVGRAVFVGPYWVWAAVTGDGT